MQRQNVAKSWGAIKVAVQVVILLLLLAVTWRSWQFSHYTKSVVVGLVTATAIYVRYRFYRQAKS